VIVEVAAVPAFVVIGVEAVVTVKSFTVTVTVAGWEKEPMVPVTTTA
jgi:hypothetical protein